MNYVSYLYEYEGFFPLLLTNYSGINNVEVKKNFDPKTIDEPIP